MTVEADGKDVRNINMGITIPVEARAGKISAMRGAMSTPIPGIPVLVRPTMTAQVSAMSH